MTIERVQRAIDCGAGAQGSVSLREPVLRYDANPILTSHHVNDVRREPALQVVTTPVPLS